MKINMTFNRDELDNTSINNKPVFKELFEMLDNDKMEKGTIDKSAEGITCTSTGDNIKVSVF